jgi:hypothetical protein
MDRQKMIPMLKGFVLSLSNIVLKVVVIVAAA